MGLDGWEAIAWFTALGRCPECFSTPGVENGLIVVHHHHRAVGDDEVRTIVGPPCRQNSDGIVEGVAWEFARCSGSGIPA